MTTIDRRTALECLGKFRHTSKRDAEKQAARRKVLTSYRCKTCGFWHVGRNHRKAGKLVKRLA